MSCGANNWMSSCCMCDRQMGHAISFHIFVENSDWIQVRRQRRHTSGWWVQNCVGGREGKRCSERASVQTRQSFSSVTFTEDLPFEAWDFVCFDLWVRDFVRSASPTLDDIVLEVWEGRDAVGFLGCFFVVGRSSFLWLLCFGPRWLP